MVEGSLKKSESVVEGELLKIEVGLWSCQCDPGVSSLT
jgi:hypothetical protein